MSVSMNPGATAFTVILRDAKFLRERLRQPDQPGLRRHVIRLARIARLAHHRRDVHDPPPALAAPSPAAPAGCRRTIPRDWSGSRHPSRRASCAGPVRRGSSRRCSPECRSRPNSFEAFANASLIESCEARSIATTKASPPAARISAATSSSLSTCRAASTTFAPAADNASAQASSDSAAGAGDECYRYVHVNLQ